jgi:hypothetical protein
MATKATKTPGFDRPPYRVEVSPGGWACVLNRDGFNCLQFPGKPGAKFTTEEDARRICSDWNADGAG